MEETIQELQEQIRKFRDERDWLQFHNHKDMATALAIEAAELQELFLWKQGDEIEEYDIEEGSDESRLPLDQFP